MTGYDKNYAHEAVRYVIDRALKKYEQEPFEKSELSPELEQESTELARVMARKILEKCMANAWQEMQK